MRLHRFFITSNIDKGKVNTFSSLDTIHQLSRVFRLRDGDKVIFFDGSGVDHESEIVSLGKTECTFRVVDSKPVESMTDRNLALAFSLIKKDNVEWIIQKGTELGVSEFIPLVSERSEKKGFNMERAQKIMIEAVEQSGRGMLAIINEPNTFEHFLKNEKRKVIAFHTEGESFKKEGFAGEHNLVACVGPEGGWTEREIKMFKEKGASICRLSAPILRAETAAIAVSTLLLL